MPKEKSTKNKFIQLNMDLYPSSKDADVSFYQELYKYKSVEDYLKKKKSKRKKKSKKRKVAFSSLISLATNDVMTSIPYDPSIYGANQVGIMGHITQPASFFDENIGNLNYGVNKDKYLKQQEDGDELDVAIHGNPPSLYGDQNNIFPIEDQFNIYETFNDLGKRNPVFIGNLDGAPNPIQKY